MNDPRSLKQWIYANIRSIRTIDEVAYAFGMKANTLRKYFRKHEGKSLSTFLKEARVDAMKEMLRTSELCCFEIADRFQYAQDASAERMFKRVTGMTMGEYRESHGNSCGDVTCLDKSRAEQSRSRAEQSRAEQSRAERIQPPEKHSAVVGAFGRTPLRVPLPCTATVYQKCMDFALAFVVKMS